MAVLTTQEKIEIGDISSYMVLQAIAKGSLFGAKLDPRWGLMLAMETDSIRWQNEFSPADTTLTQTGDYLLSICYNRQQAAVIMNGVGGGTIINPVTPSGSGDAFPIYITSNDFADATSYNNPALIGQSVVLFVNEVNRFLFAGEGFLTTATGIQIRSDANATIPGFDATTNTYNIIIWKTGGISASNTSASDLVRTIVLTENTTVSNPATDPLDGQKYTIELVQGGSGGYTVAWGSKFKFSNTQPEPEISTDVAAIDIIVFEYDADSDVYNCISQSLGFNQA